ncbi:MAG TPA: type II secretion system protein GspM [Solirubrobacteraceae bacterium]|jgi:Tfp pilus assembly protein PilO
MTTRDRLVAMGLVSAAVLAAFWLLLVSPERKKAASLSGQVATARQQLSSAQEKLNGARTAQAQYNTAYASIVRLGEAVPSSAQVPALVYQLDQLSKSKAVDFQSISASGSTSGSSSSSSASSAAATTGATFTQLPFTFNFTGSFFDLDHLLEKLNGLAVQNEHGDLQVSGRLLTIQSANLTVASSGSEAKSGSQAKSREPELTGVVTASAYVLPASQGLTAGASPSGPAGTPGAQTTSTSPGGSTTTPAAVARVTP